MWTWFRKRRALRRYRKTLGTRLVRRYGRERYYTPDQVRRTAADSGLDTTYLCYAYAMYCDQPAFDAHHRAAGELCDYVGMRWELGLSPLASSYEVIHGHPATPDVADAWYAGHDLTDAGSSGVDSGGGSWFDGAFDGGGFDGGGGDGGSD